MCGFIAKNTILQFSITSPFRRVACAPKLVQKPRVLSVRAETQTLFGFKMPLLIKPAPIALAMFPPPMKPTLAFSNIFDPMVLLARLQRKRCSEKTIILLIVGLDNAGKTSVLNRISGDLDKGVLPTIGFRTVSLKYKSYKVKIYDIGGSSQIRSIWPKYYNGIHGLIYVVDASDISRLTENKVVFGELISHEHISGKPLLLLANKQDVNGAIDELDLVENLDVEHAANAMKCPTRVEIGSCVWRENQTQDHAIGIKNGYKWLLDAVIKNYATLNARLKESQTPRSERIPAARTTSSTFSRLSVHSNPFKPINDVISKKEMQGRKKIARNGTPGKSIKRMFLHKNKTAPLPIEDTAIEMGNVSKNVKSTTITIEPQNSLQTLPIGSNQMKAVAFANKTEVKRNRPHTAPGRSQHFVNKITVVGISKQITQE